MKIKILKCSNEFSWYKSAVGQNIDCFKITDDSDALILSHVVDSIDGEDEGAAGFVKKGDFIIVQEDNITKA